MPKKAQEKSPESDNKKQAIEQVLAHIEKKYGEGVIARPGFVLDPINCISTGCPSLDYVLGGGFAKGRISEVFGAAGGGKSSIALRTVKCVQDADGLVVYIDMEHALNPRYVEDAGVSMGDMIISQPDTAEQCLNIVDQFIRSGGVDLIVIDSVASMMPEAELKGDIGDSSIALVARLMSQTLRRITAVTDKTKTHAMFINQVRDNIGPYGGNKVTGGGQALKFYSSQRLDVARVKTLMSGDKPTGHRVRVKVIKNKISTPFLTTELDLVYGEGISPMADYLNIGLRLGIITKRGGGWHSYGEESLGQGALAALKTLSERPDIIEKINDAYLTTH